MSPHTVILSAIFLASSAAVSARPPHHRGPLLPVVSSGAPEKPRTGPPAGRIVLVHGFMESGSAWRTIQKRLTKKGYECIVPQLKPKDGRGGLERAAAGLKSDIDAAFGPDQPITIISFSMGGLVSRYYLQNLGGATRCEKLFTISSPHKGTHTAFLYPTKGAAQMRPGSHFLTELDANDATLGDMRVVSYRTPLDLMILPADSSRWNRAKNLEFTVLAHPMMLTSRRVIKDLERRLRE